MFKEMLKKMSKTLPEEAGSDPQVPAIQLNNLNFCWPSSSNLNNVSKTDVLTIPDWTVNQGDSVFLYGASGSGKSTLLNIIAGILTPTKGTACILGQDMNQLSARQRDRFRAQYMGVIFQQFNLIPYLSVADNIYLSQSFSRTRSSNLSRDEPRQLSLTHSQERMEWLCDQLRLSTTLLTQPANQLSVGQQQRVAVARAVFHQPRIIIADEPTSALDSNNRDHFIQLLLGLLNDKEQPHLSENTKKTSVIFASHDQSLANQFDRSINLEEINLVAKGTRYAF